jgi:formamidopyrimidine-DNA glycosylase
MPELPEVETTLRGVAPHLLGRAVEGVVVREARLRWPIPDHLPELLAGQRVATLTRRGKYLLMGFTPRSDGGAATGALILHLGMSGSLRITPSDTVPERHDHVDLIVEGGISLRFHDPRRFGALLWTGEDPHGHPLLAHLGPEPLGEAFTGNHLYQESRQRQRAVKSFIMDGRIVVGVGNIYANESLFLAGIAPSRAAGRISKQRYERLAQAIREVLGASIRQGGTTLRDFVNASGQPGYFAQTLRVYGRDGQPCRLCGETIRLTRTGQRATFWCPHCQR